MPPQADERRKKIVIEEHRELPYALSRAWAAIADPVAYFTWNPAARLLDDLPTLACEMQLKIESPILGKTTYQHHIDPENRTVRHEIEIRLRTRFLELGRELHTWRVSERPGDKTGCVLHQTMEVQLTTFLSRLLTGILQKQFKKIFRENFELLEAWLATGPSLVEERFQQLSQAAEVRSQRA